MLVVDCLASRVNYPMVFLGAEPVADGVVYSRTVVLKVPCLLLDAIVSGQQTPRPYHRLVLELLEHPTTCHVRQLPTKGGKKYSPGVDG